MNLTGPNFHRPPLHRLSPEEIESSHSFTPQRDVWHLGVTFLRMIYGSDVVFRYPDLQTVLNSGNKPISFFSIVTAECVLWTLTAYTSISSSFPSFAEEIFVPDSLADCLREMLHPSPKLRSTPERALKKLSMMDLNSRLSPQISMKGSRAIL